MLSKMMNMRANVVKNYEKGKERYIKDEMNNLETTIVKKSGRRTNKFKRSLEKRKGK